ncbi:substrate-binding periplasmic protein [Litoribrevibacter albus]|uniref:Transporter substrate-binding domain-containing protein n=1 Tax=Litoribrevibacter albus TaxID=1473156 RepID=A0AA37W9N5_9GAMM|nr:transporter substrate-binding domain-containing protein [Litoribrevibacter albus]GLQ33539.1 hypothetical protein GCM10007876_40190 [Litoribrevibacter albus]
MQALLSFPLIALLLSFFGSIGLVHADTVYLDIGEWAPFTSEKDPDGKIAETLVREAFALEGFDVEYNYYPWKRSYERIKNGQSDGTFPWFVNPDRGDNDYFIISKERLFRDKEVFFYHVNRPFDWKEFSDLKNYVIGGVIGYSHVVQLANHGITVEAVSNEAQNYRKLMAGRIDAVPGGQIVGYYMIQKMFPEAKVRMITHHSKPLREADMFMFFSRKRPRSQEFDAAFSRGMKKLKSSGRYSTILDQ